MEKEEFQVPWKPASPQPAESLRPFDTHPSAIPITIQRGNSAELYTEPTIFSAQQRQKGKVKNRNEAHI